MKHDLDLTFGEIFKNDPKALLDQLIDIQTHVADRKKSEAWASRLRLIDISRVPDLAERDDSNCLNYGEDWQLLASQRKEPLILPLREKKEDNRKVRYVAVSWRWTKGKQLPQWGCDVRKSFDYMIQRPGKEPHKSEFPDHYFERVIMYAQSEGIKRLWIDKECIYQRPGDDPEDRDLGVQIMDAVYEGSTYSVGLLTTSLMHQDEVELLAELLARDFLWYKNDTVAPQYKLRPDREIRILNLQNLILRILSDSRWSRGWIFQEDHLASDRMILLIPHSLHVDTENKLYDFGTVPGNLTVQLSAFRRAVTMFCMASRENEQRWPISEMLGKAKQYSIFNKKPRASDPAITRRCRIRHWTDGQMTGAKMNGNTRYHSVNAYPACTLSILDDICHRDIEKVEDRVAIMANASKYSRRLDTSISSPLVTSEAYSLSAILLALILINGEIMKTEHIGHVDVMSYTLRQYLQELQYWFRAPRLQYEQSFINHCRMKESVISQHGIEAQGFLFRVLPKHKNSRTNLKPDPLKLTDGDREDIKRLKTSNDEAEKFIRKRKFNLLAEEVILILTFNLRQAYGAQCQLAAFLEEMLVIDTDPPPARDARPSTPYILDMMSALVQALLDNREVRLACFENEPDTAPPSAIFIAPPRWTGEAMFKDMRIGSGRSWVFTSWDNGWQNHGMERLASMEVMPYDHHLDLRRQGGRLNQYDPANADTSYLQNCRWVNGVWNVKGKQMDRYTFPLSGLTSPPSRPSSLKRKRDGGDDSSERSDDEPVSSEAEK